MAQGETVTFYPATSPGRGFKTEGCGDPESRMVCRGGMLLGLFSGSRTFQLGEAGGRIRFEMIEEYSGVLEGLITRTMGDQRPTFDEFAASLKKAAEARANAALRTSASRLRRPPPRRCSAAVSRRAAGWRGRAGDHRGHHDVVVHHETTTDVP